MESETTLMSIRSEDRVPVHQPTYSSAYSSSRLRELFGIDGKVAQIDVLSGLLSDRQDTILLAKTGFGKSILFQAPPLLKEGGIAIILMPLLALEAEQHRKKGAVPGGRPCILNGETNSPELRQKIRSGVFTHDYMNIAVIRNRLPKTVPLLGVTATINPRLMAEIRASSGFYPDVNIVHTALDRPEITIRVQAMHHAATSMLDLAFLLPMKLQNVADYAMIPKTLIFMDSISQITTACRLFRTWMRRLGYLKESRNWVKPFFSCMAQQDKDRHSAIFGQLSDECKDLRILVGPVRLPSGQTAPAPLPFPVHAPDNSRTGFHAVNVRTNTVTNQATGQAPRVNPQVRSQAGSRAPSQASRGGSQIDTQARPRNLPPTRVSSGSSSTTFLQNAAQIGLDLLGIDTTGLLPSAPSRGNLQTQARGRNTRGVAARIGTGSREVAQAPPEALFEGRRTRSGTKDENALGKDGK